MKIISYCLLLFCLISVEIRAQLLSGKLETPFTKYRVSSTVCSKVVHSSGSMIFIPDNAFDLSNTNATDSLDLYYREIRTPSGMVSHKIPMHFNLLGKKLYLESNGMFEIWCKNGEDTINIHEDRSVEVRFAVKPKELDIRMEGFQLNEEGQWESYTSRLGLSAVTDKDNDLWGSPTVQSDEDIYLEDEDGEYWKQDSIRRVAFQAMEIFDFGLYNYDRIIENEVYVKVSPQFINEKLEPLISTVFIVYDDLNSVFEYPQYTWADDFSIIKGKSYKLFALSEKGSVSNLKEYPDLNTIEGQQHTFKLYSQDKAPASSDELATLTGIK